MKQDALDIEISKLKTRIKAIHEKQVRNELSGSSYKIRSNQFMVLYDDNDITRAIGRIKNIYEDAKCTITLAYIDKSYQCAWQKYRQNINITVISGELEYEFRDGTKAKVSKYNNIDLFPGTEFRYYVKKRAEVLMVWQPPIQ